MPNRNEEPPLNSGNEAPGDQNTGSDVYDSGKAIGQRTGGIEPETVIDRPDVLSGEAIEGSDVNRTADAVANDSYANEWDNNQ